MPAKPVAADLKRDSRACLLRHLTNDGSVLPCVTDSSARLCDLGHRASAAPVGTDSRNRCNCNFTLSSPLSHSWFLCMDNVDPVSQLRAACERLKEDAAFAAENDFSIGQIAAHAAEFVLAQGSPIHKAADLCVAPLLVRRNLVGVRLCYANFLMDHGLEIEACKEFKEAALVSPSPLHGLALDAHRSAMSQIAPRWHFRMMNDYERNSGYRIAI